jgi:hypothetical protein
MRTNRAATLLLLASLAWGCSEKATSDGELASVSGRLALAEYPGLTSPVLIAQAEDGGYVRAAISADGEFALQLSEHGKFRFAVAHLAPDGTLVIVARIRLSDDAFWARLAAGAHVDLGTVRPSDEGVHSYDSYDDYGGHGEDDRDDDAGVRDASTSVCARDAGNTGAADLPYDVKLAIGDVFRLSDAFREKGPLPAAIVSVSMEGESWRLPELRADTSFVVSEQDCAHEGNRDIGRDRVFVTWQNADGSRETDHLDLRYCEDSSSGSSGSGSDKDGDDRDEPEHDAHCLPPGQQPPVCVPPKETVSKCDGLALTQVTLLTSPPLPADEPRCVKRDDTPPAKTPPIAPNLF